MAVRPVPSDSVRGLAHADTRVVLIGTGTHTAGSGLPPVPAVRTTLADLRRVLIERCGLRDENVTVLEDSASVTEIGLALAERAEQADDVLLVYYVGHGLVSVGGELYLATSVTDPRASRLSYTALAYAAVRDSVLNSAARSKVVVLDCCFSGRAIMPLSGSDDASVATDLARVHGGYVLASAAREELALAPEGAVHTAFTGELLRLLEAGDPDGPALLTLSHVFRYLDHALLARGFPRPHRRVSEWVDDLVLAPNPAPRTISETSAPQPIENVCPYRGLAAFGENDARWFFGRERVTTELLGRLATRLEQALPLLVVGASGAGKSSLLRAGLMPALSAGTLLVPGSRTWPRLLLTPTSDPVGALAAQVAQLSAGSPETVRQQMSSAPEAFGELIRVALRDRAEGMPISGTRAVIVVDQFEELFTHCDNEPDRDVFIRALCSAAGADGPSGVEPSALVVLGVRGDYYERCAGYSSLVPALQDGQVVLGPMRTSEVRDAIERPARAAGLTLEPGLVETLLTDLDGGSDDPVHNGARAIRGAGALPLLSHALEATWELRDQESQVLTNSGYAAIGGIRNAVATTAERTFLQLGGREQQAARRLLLRLVRVDNEAADARLSIAPDTLLRQAPDTADAATALDALTRSRLISLHRDTVEITHDALLRAWPRLRAWIDSDRAGLHIHHQLAEAAQAWDENDRPRKALYRGTALAVATDWAEGHQNDVNQLEHEFLTNSQDLHRRREEVRRSRLIKLSVSSGMMLLASFAVVILVIGEVLPQVGPVPPPVPVATLDVGASANSASFTPDGRTLAAVSDDGAVHLWDVRNPVQPTQSLRLASNTPASSVEISPDGRLLVTVGTDGTARLWDVANPSGSVPVGEPIAGHGAKVNAVSFSPNGRLLATASDDGTAGIWDITNTNKPEPIRDLVTKHGGMVTALSFSPDAQFLATAGDDGTARIWNFTNDTVNARVPIARHAGRINSVNFDPTGHVLATASYDRTVRLWDVSDVADVTPIGAPLTGHDNAVITANFDPDGRSLATASLDGVVRLWDIADPAHPKPLDQPLSQTGRTVFAEFSPDRRTLATADQSGRSITLWNLPNSH